MSLVTTSATNTTATAPTSPTALTSITAPPAVRRRDGLALAATGAIPARVRAQVLAEHRADLDARTRARIQARVDAGLVSLPLPYGYRRLATHPGTRPDTVPTAHPVNGLPDRRAAWPHLQSVPAPAWSPADLPPSLTETLVVDSGRVGRARALVWQLDHDCADTVRFMTRCVRYCMTPARIAALLNTDDRRPPLLSVSGHPRRWTASAVRSLLTDPVLTGHSVWGRTHHGRPVPRQQWIISATPTHPPILDHTTHARIVELLTAAGPTGPTGPTTTRPTQVCSARPLDRPRWRR